MLDKKNWRFSINQTEIIEDLKRKMCYVSKNYEEELPGLNSSYSDIDEAYYLPSGGFPIELQQSKIICPEIMFNPSVVGSSEKGIIENLSYWINKFDNEIKDKLLSNIVLWGGWTSFRGFKERFIKELKKDLPKSQFFKIHTSEYPCYTAWRGGRKFKNNMADKLF